MKSAAAILTAAIASVNPTRIDISLVGYPGIKHIYSLRDNVMYRNMAAAPEAHRCKIIK